MASQDPSTLPSDPIAQTLHDAALPRPSGGRERVARLRLLARLRKRWARALLALPIVRVIRR